MLMASLLIAPFLSPEAMKISIPRDFNVSTVSKTFGKNLPADVIVYATTPKSMSTIRADPLHSSIWDIFSRKMSNPSVMSDTVAELSLSRISLTSAFETCFVEKLTSKSMPYSLITSEMRVF